MSKLVNTCRVTAIPLPSKNARPGRGKNEGSGANKDFSNNEPEHTKTNKMSCASSEGSDQPGHPPSLIRGFAVHIKKPWVLSYPLNANSESSLG